jgi:hypothetical protein
MKINTITLRNIIKEELSTVLLEMEGSSNIPFPKPEEVDLPQGVKDFIRNLDIEKLVSLAKKFKVPRTLEESEAQKRKMLQRRRKRAREKAAQSSQADQPIINDTRPSVEIVTDLTALVNDKNDPLGSNTKSAEYQEGLQELIRRYNDPNDDTDKESLEKWIGMFEYAAQWPALKKQIPNIMDFLEKRKEEVSNIVEKGKQLPTKAADKWRTMSTSQKDKASAITGFASSGTFLAICMYIMSLYPEASQTGAMIGMVGLVGAIVLYLIVGLMGSDMLDDMLTKKNED